MPQEDRNNEQSITMTSSVECRREAENPGGGSSEWPYDQRSVPALRCEQWSVLQMGTGRPPGSVDSAVAESGLACRTAAGTGNRPRVNTAACGHCRAECREPGDKKKDLSIRKHRHYSSEEKREIQAVVERALQESGASLTEILGRLGISRSTWYNWLRRRDAGTLSDRSGGVRRSVPRPTPEEVACVRREAHARHLGYKRLAWTLVHDKVVYLRPWQVYEILAESGQLQDRYRPREHRGAPAKPHAPDMVWHVDLMYLRIGAQDFYLIDIIDGYSRYLVHWSLQTTMRAETVTGTLQEAFETISEQRRRTLWVVHDNGSQFTSHEWRNFVRGAKFVDIPTRVRHPQSNGMVERLHRTHRDEGVAARPPQSYFEVLDRMPVWREFYNNDRPHASLKYLTPAVYYHGNPDEALKERERHMKLALERRKLYWNKQLSLTTGENSH